MVDNWSAPLEMEFRSEKLKRLCESHRAATRKLGPDSAKRLFQRLSEIESCETLKVLFGLPGPKCELLKGKRARTYSVRLVGKYRLVFEPSGDPAEYETADGVELSKVKSVRILEVVDYHG